MAHLCSCSVLPQRTGPNFGLFVVFRNYVDRILRYIHVDFAKVMAAVEKKRQFSSVGHGKTNIQFELKKTYRFYVSGFVVHIILMDHRVCC